MKKFVALLMALCLALSVIPAFAEEDTDLERARKMVFQLYKPEKRGDVLVTADDWQVTSVVQGGDTEFKVEWTVTETPAVTLVYDDNSVFVTVDVDERSEEEVPYTLTATITDGTNTETVAFECKVPVSMSLFGLTEQEIVAKAFRLADGKSLASATVLTGVITKANEYNAEKGNIDLWFIPADMGEEYVMEAYHLSGEGADKLAVGDTITVAGKVKNYKGTIEFDSGCKLIPAEKAAAVRTVYDAFTLKAGEAMEAPATLTGVITKANEYSEKYGNIDVWFVPEYAGDEYVMEAYHMAGEGADNLAVGDTITVTGTIKNYTNSSGDVTFEFDSGCTLDAVVKAE